MAATSSQKLTLHRLLAQLRTTYPSYLFVEGERFAWSPEHSTITYPKVTALTDDFCYSLLHELGHARKMHTFFTNDLHLLCLEREAWDEAEQLSGILDVSIPGEHVEKCMDTYRDWLYSRSLCPHCKQCGIQTAKTAYSCPFCMNTWKVSESRLCRVVRRSSSKK